MLDGQGRAEAAQCLGKEKYDSPALANRVANRRNRRTRRGRGIPVGIYKCPHCGAFHMGVRDQRRPKRGDR